MTLREYLEEVTPRIGDAAEAFTELTGLTEEALYSPYVLEMDKVQRAEELASRVKELLK